MNIDRISRSTYINAYNSNSSKSIEKTKKTNDVDRIEISELGKSLKGYSLDSNIQNAKKIADIKNKIDSGTYSVDAKLTAQSMLNAMKESKA
ncbi:negative regulator of flagellin synthesis FlgM [Clostridium beijerinckii]|uniref:flagellar biosynthesis anti-sigma factor FlgM n=1 Tax=Clostridium beijerinckii TaxID=1520 RepID=UPI00156F5A51|nr:flagellar biosynthesis anti-sigma factor FlgM [Clostridium beijerinckii]NRT37036.1 negative regulator of flagellin synthesis FlgM [Clostridium beijerinckii]NRT43530.1 negative regulator of flagellin synthesis FlgM [Clostridium beijerinckii]NRZ22478.1 negative regulator of flagellin synthesis FlgM [Clostridium beijerinckii]